MSDIARITAAFIQDVGFYFHTIFESETGGCVLPEDATKARTRLAALLAFNKDAKIIGVDISDLLSHYITPVDKKHSRWDQLYNPKSANTVLHLLYG